MPCTYCNAQFSIIKWKSKCNLCMKNHCAECTVNRLCIPCNSVQSTNYRRILLMKVKVKDLKFYLKNRNYPIDTFKEKREFVSRIQALQGVYEPDVEEHTSAYITVHSTDHSQFSPHSVDDEPMTVDDPQVDANTEQMFESHANVAGSSGQSHTMHPPTYSQTQDAFPSAQDFQSREAPTTSSTHASGSTSGVASSSKPERASRVKLSELKSEEDLKTLSIRQLKFLLADNFVNCKGILEKDELYNRALNLFKDNWQNQEAIDDTENQPSVTATPSGEDYFCKICWDNPVDCVFLECAHMATCTGCSKQLRECPICRQHIVRTVRVFKS